MTDKDTILQLVNAGHRAPSADNSQPWHFHWNGEQLSLRYDHARVTGRTFPPDNQATLLSMGAAVENIVNAAQQRDLKTEIHWWPEGEANRGYYAALTFKPSPVKPLLERTKQYPSIRHTNRFPYKNTPLPQDVLDRLGELSENSARLITINEPSQITQVGQLVKSASEIRFQTREVHEWLMASLRFSEDSVKEADGLDLKTLALPPGGSYLLKFIGDWNRMKVLNRLGIYKFLATVDSAPVAGAPALLAVIAPPDATGALDAGMLLNRSWSYLNGQHIAAHPYYVISDQLARLSTGTVPSDLVGAATTLANNCQSTLGLSEGESLHMLLRVGYPKKQTPPSSLRLPIEKGFTDTSTR